MSINFPATTTSLLVNTWTTSKIVYLPAVSTIGPGKFFYIKDICGNAAKSTIYISTVGLDKIEWSFPPSTLYGYLSTNFGSVLLAPDGGTNWMVLQNYTLNGVKKGTKGRAFPLGGGACILTQIYTGGAFAICLGYGSSTGYQFYAPGWQTGTNISLTATTWTNYYGVWNGSSLVTYVNGVSVGSVNIGTADTDGGNQYRIGRRWDGADYMVGQIGEVVVFKTAFTAEQVSNDYTARRGVYGI